MSIATVSLQQVEQIPEAIPYFLAAAFFLTAVFVFLSGGEGVNSLSVVLGIALVALGGAFVWLALAEWSAIPLHEVGGGA